MRAPQTALFQRIFDIINFTPSKFYYKTVISIFFQDYQQFNRGLMIYRS